MCAYAETADNWDFGRRDKGDCGESRSRSRWSAAPLTCARATIAVLASICSLLKSQFCWALHHAHLHLAAVSVPVQLCSHGAAGSLLLRWGALQGAPSTNNDDGYATSNNYFKTFSDAHKGMHPERNSAGDLVALAAEPVCKRLFGRCACVEPADKKAAALCWW